MQSNMYKEEGGVSASLATSQLVPHRFKKQLVPQNSVGQCVSLRNPEANPTD
jgi:hypothetical protein